MLLRNNESLVESKGEYGLVNPSDRRSVSQIIGNAHLVIHVHRDQTIRPGNVLIMDEAAA